MEISGAILGMSGGGWTCKKPANSLDVIARQWDDALARLKSFVED
jgi:hypothetical protein